VVVKKKITDVMDVVANVEVVIAKVKNTVKLIP
jgi:hypothetical protein